MDQLTELAESALEETGADSNAEGISAESLLALSNEQGAEDSGVEGENSIDSTAQEALLAELEQKDTAAHVEGEEEEESEMQLKMEEEGDEFLSERDADVDADTADSNVSQFGGTTGDENTADYSESTEVCPEEQGDETSQDPVDELKLAEAEAQGVLDELSQEELGATSNEPSNAEELSQSELFASGLGETNETTMEASEVGSGDAPAAETPTEEESGDKTGQQDDNDAIIVSLSDLLDAKQGGTASEEGNESERITLNQDDLNEDAKDADHSEELALLAAIKEEAEAALSNDGVKPVLKEEPPEVVQKNSSQGNEDKSAIGEDSSALNKVQGTGQDQPEFFDKPVFYDKPEIKSSKLDDTGIATDALATLASAALGCEARSNGINKSEPADPTADTKETESTPAVPKTEANPWCDVGIISGTSCIVTKFFQTNFTNEHNELTAEDLPNYANIRQLTLEPGTAYKFRVAALNTCGRGPWSEMSAFKTCLPGYPGAPSAIKISRSSDGVHLSWEPPSSTCGKIIEYAVCLAIKSNQPPQTDPKVKAPPPQLSFVRVYCGPNNQAVVPNSSLSAAHIDTTTKPAIIFRIAAKNDKGYGPATQVRWLQDIASTQTGTKTAQKRDAGMSPTLATKKLRVE
nr:PREDICTED: host cell factor 1-like [Bemisia tabaci]